MKHHLAIFLLFAVYIIGMTALMVWQGVGIAPDRYAFILLLGSLLVKRTRSFILDWTPFLFLLIAYDFLRGFADNFTGNVYLFEPIEAERWIFNSIPTQTLQQWLYHAGNLSWYDYVLTVFYFLHFALPLGSGYLLWLYNKSYFRRFVVGISLLSYGAWATYMIFPVAPPWLANQQGYLPGIVKIMDLTLGAFPTTYELPTIYHQMNPNPVAAIPSLHAAYPFLALLFFLKFFKRKGLLFLPYVLAVWFSVVYLGEHYVVDVIAGVVYATVFFLFTERVIYHINWQQLFSKVKAVRWSNT